MGNGVENRNRQVRLRSPVQMTQNFISLIALLFLLPFASAQLDILAKQAGKKYFGTATDNYEFRQDATYLKQLSNTLDFSQLTPSNSMKWVSIISLLAN